MAVFSFKTRNSSRYSLVAQRADTRKVHLHMLSRDVMTRKEAWRACEVRVVHAKVAGTFGTFEVNHGISDTLPALSSSYEYDRCANLPLEHL